MYRYFDKHGKKTLAIFGAFLMVAFLLPTSGLNCGHGGGTHGALAGKPVNAADIDAAKYRLESLQNLLVTDPRSGQPESAWDRIFGFTGDPAAAGRLYQQLNDNALTWFLLVSEARNASSLPSEQEIDEFFTTQANPQVIVQHRPTLIIKPLKNESVIEDMRQSIRVALSVRDHFIRSLSRVKISQPMIEQVLAERAQEVKARLAIFNADDYAAQVTEPTDDELKVQFDAFAATAPGAFDKRKNPFGFGYRVPDRVRVQYFVVPLAEIEASVIKSKDAFAWEEDARFYFDKNWSQFIPAKEDPIDASQPATQPATAPVKPAFESVSEQVYQAIRKPLIESKRRVIVNQINEALNEDYVKASKNLTATTQQIADASAREQKLGSYEYLLKIRDDVQRRQGVTVSVVNEGSLLSENDLRGKPGIGLSTLVEGSVRDRGLSGARYLFTNLKQLNPGTGIAAGGRLELFQPAQAFADDAATYVLRVVEVDPSHAPQTMGDVREQLIKDVRRKNAFAKAVEAADAALEKAKASGLSSLNQVVYTTDWFGPNSMRVPGAPLTDPYADLLVEPIFNLQRGMTSEAELPRREVIPAQRADKVAAVELFAIQTDVSTDSEARMRLMAESYLSSQELQAANVIQTWFNADNIATRVGYTRPDGSAPSKGDERPRSPGSPFMP